MIHDNDNDTQGTCNMYVVCFTDRVDSGLPLAAVSPQCCSFWQTGKTHAIKVRQVPIRGGPDTMQDRSLRTKDESLRSSSFPEDGVGDQGQD